MHAGSLLPGDARWVYALRHLETGEYVCLRQSGREHLAVFTDGDAARGFQDTMRLVEFVDIVVMALGDAPFDHFWLDGVAYSRPAAFRRLRAAA